MNTALKQLKTHGFTIVELLIVIVVIGILASISIVAYNGIQARAVDRAVQSDADNLTGAETRYALANGVGGKAWFSGSSGTNGAADPSLSVTPSSGNIVDAVANATDYCIRVYNPASSSFKTISTAYKLSSTPNACTTLPPSSAAQPGGSVLWSQIAVGGGYTCGINPSHVSFCWGQGGSGQLGNGIADNNMTATPITTSGALAGKTLASIQGTNYMACGTSSDGLGFCWGDNAHGRLGNNSTTNSSVPVAVYAGGYLAGKTLKQISIDGSGYYVCALASDNLGYCWGYNTSQSNFGNNSTADSSVPVPIYMGGILAGKTLKIISMGGSGCAVASDNLAYCWGYNGLGGLGNNTTNGSAVPTAVYRGGVLAGKTITQMISGAEHTCVVASDNLAYCWGYDSQGQLGDNGAAGTYSTVPVAVSMTGALSGKTIKSISSQYNTTCVIASDNKVYCWGSNMSGMLGNGNTTDSNVPVAVSTSGVMNGKTIISLQVGSFHVCVQSDDSQTFCWGSNTTGGLGTNNNTDSSVPIRSFDPPY